MPCVQSYLHRTEADCRDLAGEGSRVRLCKGAYKEPASVAFQDGNDVDLSYVRCLKVLMAGDGYPMVASHDPRLVDIAQALAGHNGRAPDSYEFQMLHGIRPAEQTRIADRGHQMRVYVPFGEDWYGYLVRRMAERPANLPSSSARSTTAERDRAISTPAAGPARSAPPTGADRRDRGNGRQDARPRTRGRMPPPGRAPKRARAARPHPAYSPDMGMVAIFGAGVMGETLLSGLLRAGRPADQLVITERRR